MAKIPNMSPKARKAYDEALRRIEECRQKGKAGTSIALCDLGLTQVPPEIGQLSALLVLDLSNNHLTSLPPEIGELFTLENLYLRANQFTTFPLEVGRLSALTNLRIDHNQLTILPPEIGQLTKLKTLDITDNRCTSLPSSIGQLSGLTVIYLSENHLTSLPLEIGSLLHLRLFTLENNALTSLPESLKRLINLKELTLHGNEALGLPVQVLGPSFGESDSENPPANPQSILDYYFSTRGAEGRALREVKVILVGRGEVGKTSMVEALQGKPFVKARARTDGIAITAWPVKLLDGDAELTLWDFGGQEIMHGTHQFFMTHRSLYVVMVDGRHDRGRQDAEYWLKMVRAFGGESPVLVVMNRQTEHSFDMDRQALAGKHGVALEHFFRTDCETDKEISLLRETILREAERMLAAEERFPARCWEVKTRLAQMKQHGEDYLSELDYQKVCSELGVAEEAEQQKLLRRLADLGTVVSFPDDLHMAELSVLNPEWATDGIYRVVTNEELREKSSGLLTQRKLRELLPIQRWPKPLHVKYVLALMDKFDLCFPVDEKRETMLVPELLPDQTPPQGDWDPARCVVFQYRYTVLPHGVLPRFITRTHVLSEGSLRWRSGVVLVKDGAQARLQADYDAGTLTIWVRGDHANARRALLTVIRHEFSLIHTRIDGLNPEEEVAVPGHPDVLVRYHDVILDERRGKTGFPVTVAGQRVDWPIGELLDGVESAAERQIAARKASEGRNFIFEKGAEYHEHHQSMSTNKDSHDMTFHGPVTNSQVGQALTNCTNMIQQQAPGELKALLEKLEQDVKALIPKLPEDKQEDTAMDLKQLVEVATSPKPNRKWYSVSRDGLLEASKFVQDFTGNIAGTIGSLTKLLGFA